MPTVEQLEIFLRKVDRDFPVPLSHKQELSAYAHKLREKATLCAACVDGMIVSLVAGYTDNLTNGMAYIALAATLSQARGQGMAAGLVEEFLSICRQKKIGAVHLYAVRSNTPAMQMYRRLGFTELVLPDEPRPDDVHLIRYLEETEV